MRPRESKKGKGGGEERKEVMVRERREEEEEVEREGEGSESVGSGEGRAVRWPKRRPEREEEGEEREWWRREERVGPGMEIFENGRASAMADCEREARECWFKTNQFGGLVKVKRVDRGRRKMLFVCLYKGGKWRF